MNPSIKGSMVVTASALLYSVNSIVGKTVLSHGVAPLLALFMRTTITTAVFFIIILWQNKKFLSIKKEDAVFFVLLGICLFFNAVGYFLSLAFLDVSVAVILLYTYPAIIALISVVIFKEHLPKAVVCALILTFLGLLFTLNLFSFSLHHLSPIGIFLGICSAIGSAAYVFVSKKLSRTYSMLSLNLYSFLFTSLLILLLLFLSKAKLSISFTDAFVMSASGFILALAYFCYTYGIKVLPPSKAGILCSTEPAFSIILAFFLLGESITFSQGFGAVLMFSAIILLQLPPHHRRKGSAHNSLTS